MFWVNWSCWPFYHFLLQLQFLDRERWKFTKHKISFSPWIFKCNCKYFLLHFFDWNPIYIRNINTHVLKDRLIPFLFWKQKRELLLIRKWNVAQPVAVLDRLGMLSSYWSTHLILWIRTRTLTLHPAVVFNNTAEIRDAKVSKLNVAVILEKSKLKMWNFMFNHISLFGTFLKFYYIYSSYMYVILSD